MILPLTLPPKPSPSSPVLPPVLACLGSSELFLLELQGDLEVSGDKYGQLVGRLTIDEDGKGKPTLRIGYHLLEGKIISLPKPLAILQRVDAPLPNQRLPDGEGDPDGDVDMLEHSDDRDSGEANPEPTTTTASSSSSSYAIRTLIRKKIVFSKRPTPIVGLSAKIS